jgi:hypothetical protein
MYFQNVCNVAKISTMQIQEQVSINQICQWVQVNVWLHYLFEEMLGREEELSKNYTIAVT